MSWAFFSSSFEQALLHFNPDTKCFFPGTSGMNVAQELTTFMRHQGPVMICGDDLGLVQICVSAAPHPPPRLL